MAEDVTAQVIAERVREQLGIQLSADQVRTIRRQLAVVSDRTDPHGRKADPRY